LEPEAAILTSLTASKESKKEMGYRVSSDRKSRSI